MLQKKWFRVEQDASGAILSCVEVDTAGRVGATVRFYDAIDKAEACSKAKAWHEAIKLRDRERQSAVRADKKRRGECRHCKCKALPGGRYCATHRAINRGSGERRPRGVNISAYEAIAKLDELGPIAFRAWLVSKIPVIAEAAE